MFVKTVQLDLGYLCGIGLSYSLFISRLFSLTVKTAGSVPVNSSCFQTLSMFFLLCRWTLVNCPTFSYVLQKDTFVLWFTFKLYNFRRFEVMSCVHWTDVKRITEAQNTISVRIRIFCWFDLASCKNNNTISLIQYVLSYLCIIVIIIIIIQNN